MNSQRRMVALMLVVAAACNDTSSYEEPTEQKGGVFALSQSSATNMRGEDIVLPLEVLGGPGYTVDVSFQIDDPAGINRLYLQGHRLAFVDSSLGQRQAKGSFRINGGAWTEIDDDTANVFAAEKAVGGIRGGYHTVRMTLPLSGVVRGENKLEFRLDRSDGISLGYRILDFNVLRNGANVLPDDLFVQDDPADWKAPRTSKKAIAKGKELWETHVLVESPFSDREMKASCADCHAHDGSDLKYFNYSNWSIQARAEFHGMGPVQAEKVASYIRSLDTPAPPQARPWNPPYQPGRGLDDLPAEQWAAGAGLKAVLDDDSEMLLYLFPNGTTPAGIGEVANPHGNLNVRELPIALQLPDWNAWLPLVHPKDVWGDAFVESEGYTSYVAARERLETEGVRALMQSGELGSVFSETMRGVKRFVATGQEEGKNAAFRIKKGAIIDSRDPRFSREMAKVALAHWAAVKSWELAQDFDLAETAQELTGEELRAWPGTGSTVFPLAAHLLADDITQFEWESTVRSKYMTTSWYQLQMIINAGQRAVKIGSPMDWKYHFRHITHLNKFAGVKQPLRMTSAIIKGYQTMNNGSGPNRKGWKIQETHPLWFYGETATGESGMIDALDDYERGLRGRIMGGLIEAFIDVSASFDKSDWRRCSGGGTACIEPASHKPTLPEDKFFGVPEDTHADNFWRLLPLLKGKDVPRQTREELADWCELMWPKGDWASLL